MEDAQGGVQMFTVGGTSNPDRKCTADVQTSSPTPGKPV